MEPAETTEEDSAHIKAVIRDHGPRGGTLARRFPAEASEVAAEAHAEREAERRKALPWLYE